MRALLIDCVIFDLDGTLIDSETYCLQALKELLPGLPLSTQDLTAQYRGVALHVIVQDIEARFGLPVPNHFEQRYRERSNALILDHARPFPGVVEALRHIALPKCVASGGPPSKIAMVLETHRLADFFGSAVFSSYDINAWKPSPLLFLHAAKMMNAAPARCLVIEDSKVGVEAAQAAGMHVLHFCQPEAPSFGVERFHAYSALPDLVQALVERQVQS